MGKEGKGLMGTENLMADVSDCLDKYRLFKIEDLIEATDGFSESCLIQGSVYRGSIDGEVYAIKKMKWNAYEELKILQKVTKFSSQSLVSDADLLVENNSSITALHYKIEYT